MFAGTIGNCTIWDTRSTAFPVVSDPRKEILPSNTNEPAAERVDRGTDMQVGNVQEANPSVPSNPERPENCTAGTRSDSDRSVGIGDSNCKLRIVYEKFQPWGDLSPKLAVHVRAVLTEFSENPREHNLYEIGNRLIEMSGRIHPLTQIEALQEYNDALVKRVAAAEAQINQLSVSCDNLEVELQESEDLVKSLTNGLNRVQGEMAGLHKSVHFLTDQNDAMRREIAAKDEVNAKVTKEKSDLFVQVMSLANGMDQHCEACEIVDLVRKAMGGVNNRVIKQFFLGLTLNADSVVRLCRQHDELALKYKQECEISKAYSNIIIEKDQQIEDLCRIIESRDAQIRDMEGDFANAASGYAEEVFSPPPTVVVNITNYGFMHDKITQSIIDSIEKQGSIG